jgi:hypothetical protein
MNVCKEIHKCHDFVPSGSMIRCENSGMSPGNSGQSATNSGALPKLGYGFKLSRFSLEIEHSALTQLLSIEARHCQGEWQGLEAVAKSGGGSRL